MRIAGAALAGGLSVAGAAALAPVVLAQDGGPGPRLTFGLSQTFDVNDNLDLDVDSAGSTAQSFTGLSFGLSSETEISALEFFAGTALRLIDGPDSGNTLEFDLDGTRVGLGYDRGVAAAALSVDSLYTMDQIDTTLTLADFGPGDEVPEDFGDLQGTGMRRFFSLGAALSLGLDDPIGYELSAGGSVLSYSDTSDPDLFGNTRARVGAAVVARLDARTRGRLGLNYSSFSTDDPEGEDSDDLGLDLGVTRELPNGSAGVVIFLDNYTDSQDSRAGFSLTRALELPAGALAASLGATQLDDQNPELTGRLAWEQALPNGGLSLAANHSLQNNANNQPQYVTGLRFGYAREIDPLSQFGIDIAYALTENALPPVDSTSAASFSAIYSRDLTEDWALDIGYTYRQRDDNDSGMARSNAVFLGLRRAWELRP
jgi:hypothetical protein